MKALIQRVKKASVSVEGSEIASINTGLLVFFGVHQNDNSEKVKKLVKKIIELRVFNDENQKMNLSCVDTQNDILLVSQFTLYADCKKGRRPSYIEAASPELAQQLYTEAIIEFEQQFKPISTGQFAANMLVSLENDGPVTLIVEV